MEPRFEQAHVIVEGDAPNARWAFVLWLVPEQGWQIHHFQAKPTQLAGKSANEMQDLARLEEARDHHFNAAVLYGTARSLADLGPNFRLRVLQDITSEIAKVALPPELQGQAPYTWHLENAEFRILAVGPFGAEGKLYLRLTHEVAPWRDDQEAEQRNRELMPRFARAFPEYSTVFAGLIAEARERGTNRGYRTIDTAAGSQ
jgi:hypothetical protein